MSAEQQPAYEIYVDDDRYGVPTLHLVIADDDDEAREVLERLLNENAHHRGGEVWVAGRVRFRVGSYAAQPRERPVGRRIPPLSGRDLIEVARRMSLRATQDESCEGA